MLPGRSVACMPAVLVLCLTAARLIPLQSKKGKTKMPSLVKKWQSIQRELDEEENSSSSEEDRETTAQRRIEEWKQQQLLRYGHSSFVMEQSHPLIPLRGRECNLESLAGGRERWGECPFAPPEC